MDKTVNAARAAELVLLAQEYLSTREWFDYYDWDSLIECDHKLSPEELQWLEDNFTVELRLLEKSQ